MKSSKKFISKICLALIIISGSCSLLKAQMPETDIFLVDMKVDNGAYTFGKPENITSRKGYDNQPRFDLKGQSLYYVADMDGKQTDMMLYNWTNKKSTQLTKTPESEYSPTPVFGTDYVTTVRVDKDSSQHVYRYTRLGLYPLNMTPKNDSVGYHAWLGDKTLALFVLGKPITLQRCDIVSQKYDTIAENVGRSLQALTYEPAVFFTIKTSDSTWTINKYNLKTNDILKMGDCLVGVEDFALTRDGKIFSGKNGKLYMMNPYQHTDWKEVADFSKTIGDFYRIAISPKNDKIAIVGFTGKKP